MSSTLDSLICYFDISNKRLYKRTNEGRITMGPRIVIYCRKSTDEDDKQILSLSAQSRLCQDFAQRSSINVIKELHESASAKQKGRPVFNELVRMLENNEIDGVLCHKEDRLTRNLDDSAKINDLMDKNKIFLFTTGSYDNTPQGKFLFNIISSTSKWFVDNLSEETKKGLNEKINQGDWGGWAPTGYLNENKRVIIDPNKSTYIKRAFSLMNTGLYSLNKLSERLSEEGFRSRQGKPINQSTLYSILTNPFYYGVMRWNGKTHPGNHEGLITEDVWIQTQLILKAKGKSKPSKHLDFAYRGFLTCGECGCKITAERQKGHVYYRCTKSKGGAKSCSQPYIREEDLETEIAKGLRIVSSIDEKNLNLIRDNLRLSHKEETEYRKKSVDNLGRLLAKNREKSDRILDLRIDGEIEKDTYERKVAEYKTEERSILSMLDNTNQENSSWFENAELLLDLAYNAHKLFLLGDYQQKRDLISSVSSNLVLTGKSVDFEYKKPFDILTEGHLHSNWLPGSDSNRRPID